MSNANGGYIYSTLLIFLTTNNAIINFCIKLFRRLSADIYVIKSYWSKLALKGYDKIY